MITDDVAVYLKRSTQYCWNNLTIKVACVCLLIGSFLSTAHCQAFEGLMSESVAPHPMDTRYLDSSRYKLPSSLPGHKESDDVPTQVDDWSHSPPDSPDSEQEPDNNRARKPYGLKGGRRTQYDSNDDGRSKRSPYQEEDPWMEQSRRFNPRQYQVEMEDEFYRSMHKPPVIDIDYDANYLGYEVPQYDLFFTLSRTFGYFDPFMRHTEEKILWQVDQLAKLKFSQTDSSKDGFNPPPVIIRGSKPNEVSHRSYLQLYHTQESIPLRQRLMRRHFRIKTNTTFRVVQQRRWRTPAKH